MKKLQQKKLQKLNKLLMEQPKYSRKKAKDSIIAKYAKDDSIGASELVGLAAGGTLTLAQLVSIAKLKGISTGAAVGAAETAAKAGLMSQIFAGLVAAAFGVGVGTLINRFVYPGYEGEALERIQKATSDFQYGLDELELYCRGTGPLCGRSGGDVKCVKLTPVIGRDKKTGKRTKKMRARKLMGGFAVGGYQYERATGLGVGKGRERDEDQGMEGDGVFTQTPGSFDSKDLAVIAGIANALIYKDILDGKIKYTKGETIKLPDDALIKPYEKCIKGLLGSSFATQALGQYDWLKDKYDVVQTALGLKKFVDLKRIRKIKAKDSDAKKASPAGIERKDDKNCDMTYPITFGCRGRSVSTMLGILVQGTNIGAELYNADKEKFQELWKNQTFTPEVRDFVLQVLKSDEVRSEYPELAKDFEKDLKIDSITDPLAKYLNQLATDKDIKGTAKVVGGKLNECVLTSNIISLNENYAQKRLLQLNQKLMEQIK
ncbi:MAG TPA: hypothetical protein DG048_06975 [Pseudoalteromonas sp.]|nr:hypothetical protein [Pseudoalteromonas sp.]